jgi:hypothetical protein
LGVLGGSYAGFCGPGARAQALSKLASQHENRGERQSPLIHEGAAPALEDDRLANHLSKPLCLKQQRQKACL